MVFFWIIWIIVLIFGLVVLRGAPYVPSRRRYVDIAFTKLYPLSKKDFLVDIGSGDGIVLRRAQAYGAKAVGYEINPILVIISRLLSRNSKHIKTLLADAWTRKFPDNTTVVYVFTAGPYVKRIEKKLQMESSRLNRPLSLILYGNNLPERKAEKKIVGYSLYMFFPLQTDEA